MNFTQKMNRNAVLRTLRAICGAAIAGSAVAGIVLGWMPEYRDAVHNAGALFGAVLGTVYFAKNPVPG